MQRRTVLLVPSNDCGWAELTLALTAMPDIEITEIERPVDRQRALSLAAALRPNFVIAATRIRGESTLPFLADLHRCASPASRIVLLTARFRPDEMKLMYGNDVGVSAHLQWHELHPKTLPHLLEFLILDDFIIISREVIEAFVAASNVSPRVDHLPAPLAPREAEILRLMAEGLTEKEIAQAQGTSRRTVERLVGNLERKLGARTQFALAIKANQLGMLG